MKSENTSKRISLFYLFAVPFLVASAGFGIGKISPAIYLPIWILNVMLMISACWTIGLNKIRTNRSQVNFLMGSFFLIVPWILISMFFGIGPPPATAASWVETATEQQIRYSMLTTAGIFIAFGFALLKEKLNTDGENFFSLLGIISIMIAIPLFILDMLFWGFTLTDSFKLLVSANADKLPEWFNPLRVLFGMISVVEVALTYLAIAFFAVSMKRVGFISSFSSKIYLLISLFGFTVIVLSAFLPEPFVTAGFAVSIPAAPFLMPYFMGIHLLSKT